MNKTLIQVVFILLMASVATAQTTVVRNGMAFLGGAENPVTMIEIENASLKSVEKKWRSYIGKYKGKVSKQGDEYFHDNAMIKSISRDTLDMWSTLKETGKTITITLAANSNGVFISTSEGNQRGVEDFLIQFSNNIKKDQIKLELAAAQKALKAKSRDFDKLEKENKKLEKVTET
jgi:hypothetical protein